MYSVKVVRVSNIETLQTRLLLITLFMNMVWTVEHAAIFSLCRERKPVINVLMEDDWLAGFFISFVVSFVQENILPFEKFIILYRPI